MRHDDSTTDRGEIIVEDETLAGGFVQLPRYVLRHPDLSPGAKLVYASLLDYAWREDRCFPGQSRMAADLGLGVSTVRNYTRELERVGLVVVTRRGLNKTNLYRLPRFPP